MSGRRATHVRAPEAACTQLLRRDHAISTNVEDREPLATGRVYADVTSFAFRVLPAPAPDRSSRAVSRARTARRGSLWRRPPKSPLRVARSDRAHRRSGGSSGGSRRHHASTGATLGSNMATDVMAAPDPRVRADRCTATGGPSCGPLHGDWRPELRIAPATGNSVIHHPHLRRAQPWIKTRVARRVAQGFPPTFRQGRRARCAHAGERFPPADHC